MFDVKDSDFFDMEDDAFDTIVEDDISFNGSIKMQKPFMIRGKITGKIETQSDLVIDTNAVVEAEIVIPQNNTYSIGDTYEGDYISTTAGVLNYYIGESTDLVIPRSLPVVEADIKADRVLIRGKVKGNVYGEKLIFVTASGSLDGDIITQKVVLEPGSDFSGKCTMVKK